MSQLGRIVRNLIRAEEYMVEHREWLDGLFLPLTASPEAIQKHLQRNQGPMADPKTAFKESKTIRSANEW